MKTFTLPVTMIVLLLFAGCAKDGIIPDDSLNMPGNQTLLINKGDCVDVFTVFPNGIDDTENLKKAFADAQAAGSGSLVQLVEGNYYLGFIEIREFTGSFTGAGKGKTVINFLSNLDCSPYARFGNWDVMIKFIGGDISMENMTLKVPAEAICPNLGGGYSGAAAGLVIFSTYTTEYISPNPTVIAVVDNVEFLGHAVTWGEKYNCIFGLMSGPCGVRTTKLPAPSAVITVTNCTFDTFNMGIHFSWLNESVLRIGEKTNGNTFYRCDYHVVLWDDTNMDIKVIGNEFNILSKQYGVSFNNTVWGATILKPQLKLTICEVMDNDFNISGSWWGAQILDNRRQRNENMPVAAIFKNNEFNFSENAQGGIALGTTVDAVIRNNKFTGYGIVGVYGNNFTKPGYYNENTLLLGNNFSNAEFRDASMFLTARTKNWTIIGGGTANETIIDMGGTGNVFTGVNVKSFDGSLGQTIVDNLHLMDSLFDHLEE